jgi:peptide/nickel transport system substrate-binding protein
MPCSKRFSMAAANSLAVPMPKHLLEGPYRESKATLHENAYWLSQFVGTGAYRMKQFSDTGLVLEAWDGYVFGRPKIEEIAVRWVTDPNTYVANILAGTADLTVGPGLTVEQAQLLKNQWNGGRVDTLFRFWIRMNPQLLESDPVAISDLRFRQAMTQAMDRQAMVETLQAGVAPVAHIWLNPTHALFQEVEPSVVKYEFDPRRATQLLEEMGYRKGSDGMYRDGSGQPLSVEIRALESLDIQVKSMLSVADYWKRLGVGVETVAIPRQREQDRAYRSTFPGFEVTRFNTDVDRLSSYHSTMIPTRENNYAGQNRSRYPSPELDSLIDRYFSTIPQPARTQILGQVAHQVSDQLIVIGLFHDPEYAVVSNRMVNVAGAKGDLAPAAWNVQDWDMR